MHVDTDKAPEYDFEEAAHYFRLYIYHVNPTQVGLELLKNCSDNDRLKLFVWAAEFFASINAGITVQTNKILREIREREDEKRFNTANRQLQLKGKPDSLRELEELL